VIRLLEHSGGKKSLSILSLPSPPPPIHPHPHTTSCFSLKKKKTSTRPSTMPSLASSAVATRAPPAGSYTSREIPGRKKGERRRSQSPQLAGREIIGMTTTRSTRPQPRRRSTKIAALGNDAVLSAAAASADAAQPIYDVNDPVVTAVFTLATVALSVVTVGVAYLSITGWIDSRNEEAEKKRVEAAERSR